MVQMRSMPKKKRSCHDRLNRVRSVMKVRQNNDMANSIGLVYVEIETKLLGPI